MKDSRREYYIDTIDGSIYEQNITVKKIHVASSSLIKNTVSIQVVRLNNDSYLVVKMVGGNVTDRYHITIPSTIQVKYPLKLESDGQHLHAVHIDNSDITLDRPLLLRNFIVKTMDGTFYKCKPMFIVRIVDGIGDLSRNELENNSYFFYVGVDKDGKGKLFQPPLSNVYDDGRMCNGSSLMKSHIPKFVKSEQLLDHYSLSMGNSDLSTPSLTHYARWDINEVHSPNSDDVTCRLISNSMNEIVQALVDNIRGR